MTHRAARSYRNEPGPQPVAAFIAAATLLFAALATWVLCRGVSDTSAPHQGLPHLGAQAFAPAPGMGVDQPSRRSRWQLPARSVCSPAWTPTTPPCGSTQIGRCAGASAPWMPCIGRWLPDHTAVLSIRAAGRPFTCMVRDAGSASNEARRPSCCARRSLYPPRDRWRHRSSAAHSRPHERFALLTSFRENRRTRSVSGPS
jgi:hypothetical protein